MIWFALSALLALLLLVDTLRMRARAGQLATLPPSDAPADHVFVTAPGVTLDDATRRAASAYARAHGIELLDLVPRDLPASRAMSLLQVVEPAQYRADRLGPGRSAGHALCVAPELAARATLEPPADDVAFARLAARLKLYARSADLAVAPDEHARPPDLSRRYDVLRVALGPMTPLALVILPVFWAIMAVGIWRAPIAGLVALALWHLQAPLSLAGGPLRPRDLALATVLRWPMEAYLLVRTALGRRASDAAAAASRPAYDALLAGGTQSFFEPRRETCPVCRGADLAVHLRNGDLLQHKPGRFTLERCRGCGHIFQNPRLSLAGLDFYYKDFYDGLGEEGMELIFGFGAEPYHARAKMVREVAQPARWLDVGAGHGHFCAAARAHLPETRFDGLDLSESIEDAERRGWVEKGYRGLFPELAPGMAGRYDAISMSHYLEHTLDQRAELAAAHTALAPGGHLMIEVPDPEFVLGRVLGRFWLPWFQPQHQHMISVGNLERLLREAGFEPLAWHRGQAHQTVDFFFAAWLLLGWLGPPAHAPWHLRGAATTARRVLVWTLGAPLLVAGTVLDHLVAPGFRRAKTSNTYRVLAQRVEAAP